jgi:hypothetical protein
MVSESNYIPAIKATNDSGTGHIHNYKCNILWERNGRAQTANCNRFPFSAAASTTAIATGVVTSPMPLSKDLLTIILYYRICPFW